MILIKKKSDFNRLFYAFYRVNVVSIMLGDKMLPIFPCYRRVKPEVNCVSFLCDEDVREEMNSKDFFFVLKLLSFGDVQ